MVLDLIILALLGWGAFEDAKEKWKEVTEEKPKGYKNNGNKEEFESKDFDIDKYKYLTIESIVENNKKYNILGSLNTKKKEESEPFDICKSLNKDENYPKWEIKPIEESEPYDLCKCLDEYLNPSLKIKKEPFTYTPPTSHYKSTWESMSSKELRDHGKVLQQQLNEMKSKMISQSTLMKMSSDYFKSELRNSAPPADKLFKKY